MKFILFILFLITPPNGIKDTEKGTAKDKRIWALQSTATMELESRPVCEEIGRSIERSTNVTSTITIRFYCYPKTEADLNALIEANKPTAAVPQPPTPAERRQRDESIDNATTFKPRY